jgi:hypothetical protein
MSWRARWPSVEVTTVLCQSDEQERNGSIQPRSSLSMFSFEIFCSVAKLWLTATTRYGHVAETSDQDPAVSEKTDESVWLQRVAATCAPDLHH